MNASVLDKRSILSSLLSSSGLSHTPRSEKSEISFNLQEEDTYRLYVKAMKEMLEPYKEEKQVDDMKFEDCGGTLSFGSQLGPTLRRTHCIAL